MASKAYVAGGTIRVCRFVKISTAADFNVLECDANEAVYGISQEASRETPIPSVTTDPPEAAQSGEQLNVFTDRGMVVMLRAGTGGWTRGDELEADADGNGVTAGTTANSTRNIGARALESVSAGELGRVEIQIYAKKIAA